MKIVQINATCGSGSTGKICVAVSRLLTDKGIENYILYSNGHTDYQLGIKYATSHDIRLAALESRLLGNWGFEGKSATKKLIAELERIKPDIVHLHNLHSHACNLDILMNWLKKHKVKIFWTFHDCWTFTGYCVYYDMCGCNKWKETCKSCYQRKAYSWIFDKSDRLFSKKRKLFSGVDLTIITPSKWLANQVKQSFLKEYSYSVRVITTGINLSTFRPMENNFREKYNIPADKYILLGISFEWEKRKGLDVFIELSKRLDPKYQIVLVGIDERTDKQLPASMILIPRTQNQQELAEIYSAADLFVNPTREEVLGLVNIEALACGTPVVTFNSGGSPEVIDETCGSVVETDDIAGLEKEILYICERKPYSKDACLKRAAAFDMDARFQEYIDLYEEFSN